MKEPRRLPSFIALQVSNQLPRGAVKINEARPFRFPLLNAILSKMPQPRFVCFANRLTRMRFRYTDQRNLIRMASGLRRRSFDPLPQPR